MVLVCSAKRLALALSLCRRIMLIGPMKTFIVPNIAKMSMHENRHWRMTSAGIADELVLSDRS